MQWKLSKAETLDTETIPFMLISRFIRVPTCFVKKEELYKFKCIKIRIY